MGPVEAARLPGDRFQQVDPPDGLADGNRLGGVDRPLEVPAFEQPEFQPDPALRALLPLTGVGVDEV